MSSYGGTSTANGPSAATEPGSKTEQAKEQAKDKAREATGQAKNRVSQQVDERSTQAGEQVSSMASDARSVAEELRNQGKEQPAKLAEQAAQRAESLGDYLQNKDGDAILRDLEDFGRRQPWAVIAGGLALGFAASRFLKASSSRRYESQWEQRGTTNGAPATRGGLTAGDVVPQSGTGTVVTDPSAAGGDIPPREGATGVYYDDAPRVR